jgi:hypothetical protein
MSLPSFNEDKIRGMLIGMCIGDALGSKYEEDFDMAQYNPFLEGHGKVTVKNGYSSSVEIFQAGELSDASLIPLELARSLVVSPVYPWQRNNIINRYMLWLSSEKRQWSSPDMDRYFKGVKTVSGYEKRWAEDSRQPPNKMLINESVLTRMIPLSLITASNQISFDEVKLTHHEPLVFDAAILYCNALRLALWDINLPDINSKVKDNTQYPVIRSSMQLGEHGTPCSLTGPGRTACFNPFYLLGMMEYQQIDSFDKAIEFIITNYQTGDIRYLCSLIGAFYGAYLGYNTLDKEESTKYNIGVVRAHKYLQDFDTLCLSLKNLSS